MAPLGITTLGFAKRVTIPSDWEYALLASLYETDTVSLTPFENQPLGRLTDTMQCPVVLEGLQLDEDAEPLNETGVTNTITLFEAEYMLNDPSRACTATLITALSDQTPFVVRRYPRTSTALDGVLLTAPLELVMDPMLPETFMLDPIGPPKRYPTVCFVCSVPDDDGRLTSKPNPDETEMSTSAGGRLEMEEQTRSDVIVGAVDSYSVALQTRSDWQTAFELMEQGCVRYSYIEHDRHGWHTVSDTAPHGALINDKPSTHC